MIAVQPQSGVTARERLLDAAYRLFAVQGISQVGVDTVVAEASCAKSSLYQNFQSKAGLALAFLERREQMWTRDWLEQGVKRRAHTPHDRLLAIFDLFDEWFRHPDFEGCSFVKVLLESGKDDPVHDAAAAQLAKIRSMIRGFAAEAGLADVDGFSHTWHMLMKGSIVSACEGNLDAARQARLAAQIVLERWPQEQLTRSA